MSRSLVCHRVRLGLLAGALWSVSHPAQAAAFEWTFSGNVSDVEALSPRVVTLPAVMGRPFVLTALIDMDAPNLCLPDSGGWYDAIGPSRLTIGDYGYRRKGGSGLEVNAPDGNCGLQHMGSGVTLRYLPTDSFGDWTVTAGTPEGWYVWYLFAGFDGYDPSTAAIPGPSTTRQGYLTVFLSSVYGDVRVSGNAELTVGATPIPESPGAVMTGLGALVWIWRRRRESGGASPRMVRTRGVTRPSVCRTRD